MVSQDAMLATIFTAGLSCNSYVSKSCIWRKIRNGITCNLTNKSEVMKVMKQIKPDYVLHLAGRNSVIESWTVALEYIEVNVIGTLYLLEAIKQEASHCRTLVIGSALQADSMNEIKISNPYSLSKTMQVIIAEAWGGLMDSNIIIAKPSNLIGPGNRMAFVRFSQRK